MQSLDDDFSFDSSVWGVPAPAPSLLSSPLPTSLPSSSPAPSHDQLDDFDDFHTPLESTTQSLAQDDDFADFGDFGEVGDLDVHFTSEEDTTHGKEIQEQASSQLSWRSLYLDPLHSVQDLSLQIEDILGPVWPYRLSNLTRDEDIRQVEGISQILTTSTSRDLYSSLLDSPPLMESVSWVRSRIRQQHLIALGLPVNLDEILPQATAKPLPPLHISTRPVSAPPGAANGPIRRIPSSRSSSRAGTRSNTPQTFACSASSTVMELGLGPKPELDAKKINELLKLDTDQLNLLPLTRLDKYLADLRTETTNTSALLTYLLQTRDALQQDSETYNKLIAELVIEAQKPKSGKSRVKRGGTMT